MAKVRTFIASRDDPTQALAIVRANYSGNNRGASATRGLIHSPRVTLGLELRGYLNTILHERSRQSLAIGSLDGWARAICLVAAKIDGAVNALTVGRHLAVIALPIEADILTPVIDECAAALAAGAFNPTPRSLGEGLQLTAAEREEYGIRRLIGACDESDADRRRRHDRQRKAGGRGARPRDGSLESTKPWLALGVSRRTWFRRMALFCPQHSQDSIGKKSAAEQSVPTTGEADETVPKSGGQK